MELTITDEAYQSVLAQAQNDAPVESCGYLLGPDRQTVTMNYPMRNIDHSEEHFSFDPREQFAAVRVPDRKKDVLAGDNGSSRIEITVFAAIKNKIKNEFPVFHFLYLSLSNLKSSF